MKKFIFCALILVGCGKPSPTLEGTWSRTAGGVTLTRTYTDGTFDENWSASYVPDCSETVDRGTYTKTDNSVEMVRTLRQCNNGVVPSPKETCAYSITDNTLNLDCEYLGSKYQQTFTR